MNAFLRGTRVEEPFEYLRAICSASSANYPMYFFLKQANAILEQAIKVVEETTVRGRTDETISIIQIEREICFTDINCEERKRGFNQENQIPKTMGDRKCSSYQKEIKLLHNSIATVG